MNRKVVLGMLSLVAALTLCFGLAACNDSPSQEGSSQDSLQGSDVGDEHLLFEKNKGGDGYTVTGLSEDCTHTEIVVPAVHEGLPVTKIGDMAFLRDQTIEKVTLPDSVKTIGQFAFNACSSLKEADIGDGAEVIGTQSFYACTALEKVNFPKGLKEIDAYAFSYTALTEVVIPDEVIRIGVAAFGHCSSVTKLTLGKSLKSLGSLSFSGISAEKIVMPDSLTDLGYGCFSSNTALKSVSVGWGCTGLPYGTFFGCTSLESVTINNWCTIMDSAFGDCTAFRRVYFALDEETWETYCSVGTESDENPINSYGNTTFREADVYFYSETPIYDGEHWGYDENGNETVWEQPVEADRLIYEKNEDGTAYTVTGLEEDCTDKKIIIPATHDGLPVTKIGDSAFRGNGYLEDVVLSSEVTEIAFTAFGECEGLKAVTFSKRLRTIGGYAFYGCTSLKKVDLPAALRGLDIGEGAFARCAELESVSVPKHAVFDLFAFQECNSLTEVTFEEGFDGLGPYAFAYCASLTAITLPEGMTEVAPFAFTGCPLTEVVIPKSVRTVGVAAFMGCENLSKVTLQEGLYDIGTSAFEGTALTEVIIPDGVFQMGSQAFAFIDTLEYVRLGSTLASSGYGVFAMCTNLKTVVLTNPRGNISDAAFGGCTALETVYFTCGTDGTNSTWELYCDYYVNQDSFENEANGFGNKALLEMTKVYSYSEKPVYDGKHWHFGEDGKPQLWEEE